jgi:S-adenosyl methyltransferase
MPDLPPEIDTSSPHPARVYDYLIGGKSNFAADRETAAKVLLKSPNARIAPPENRAFLGRAVRFLAGDVGRRRSSRRCSAPCRRTVTSSPRT